MGGVFNPGGGGGGGAAGFADWKTIGTGGQYSDVQAAIDDSQYSIVLVSDVTEDSDITVPSADLLVIDLGKYVWTMGTNQIEFGATTTNLVITGLGEESGAEIDYSQTAGSNGFINSAGSNNEILLESFLFDNNSTAANCTLVSGGSVRVRNLKIELPNQEGGGIQSFSSNFLVESLEMVGGGTSCSRGIYLSSDGHIVKNILMTGTWSTTDNAIEITDEDTSVDCIFTDLSTNGAKVRLCGTVSNINADGQTLALEVAKSNSSFTNIRLNGGNLDVVNTNTCQFSNLQDIGVIDMTDASAHYHQFNTVRSTGAISVSGDRNQFTNFTCTGGITFVNGAVNNTFQGRAGADAGGGSNTITFDAGANNNTVYGTMTDAAISHSGTGNDTSSGNKVY
jgi:hypothetical protein